METINFQNIEIARELFGHRNQNLVRISDALNVKISTRGNDVSCSGDPEDTRIAVTLLNQLYDMMSKQIAFGNADIDAAIKVLKSDPEFKLKQMFEKPVYITEKKKPITPRNPAQQAYVNAIASNDLLFAIGPAGTGKTYLAMAMAVAAFSRGEVSRIILTRPAVEAGEALGFLPGDLAEKINPYLRPLYDALYDMIAFEKARLLIENQTIEIAPLAFMRGRTLNNAFIILDEAQNTTSQQMKMFLTRIGYGSKAIITGDITQIDLPQGKKSGLIEAKSILRHITGIQFSNFTKDDVVRHPLVSRIIDAYEKKQS